MPNVTLPLELSGVWAQTVGEVARRIVALAHPQRILLFGLGSRGQVGPDSDLDFLVIVRKPVHRHRLEQQIYRNLHGVGVPVDIVVATEEDIALYGESVGTIYRSPAGLDYRSSLKNRVKNSAGDSTLIPCDAR